MGATGLQGRAVTKRLLADGWRIRALTRDPDAAPARALEAAGARTVRGDMEDVATLIAAAEGAYGVFSVQPTVGSPGTAPGFAADDEVRWGVNVAEAAHAAGVRQQIIAVDDLGLFTARAFAGPQEWIGRTIDLAGEDFAYAYEWLNERGYRADISLARQLHPGLLDFRTWLARTGAARIAAFLDAPRAGQK
ncbi:NmrA family NAD(P)-binding protein [Nonomuraea sp. NPDC026600]|uniref:NmrA family NAD(P)-binding protein n=1 Tax=Nonomuraea sp. NPDC026600 TaxID=3155363 RepID=UPI003407F481